MRDLRGNEKIKNKNGQLLFENIVSTSFDFLDTCDGTMGSNIRAVHYVSSWGDTGVSCWSGIVRLIKKKTDSRL